MKKERWGITFAGRGDVQMPKANFFNSVIIAPLRCLLDSLIVVEGTTSQDQTAPIRNEYFITNKLFF